MRLALLCCEYTELLFALGSLPLIFSSNILICVRGKKFSIHRLTYNEIIAVNVNDIAVEASPLHKLSREPTTTKAATGGALQTFFQIYRKTLVPESLF